ncbi:MAG: hypothetical protein WD894_01920 [Pirellulales bacterium]
MLILVVLSLLILFVVIAVMFVIVASRARAVSKSYAEFNRTGDTPQEIVHGIALDLIRGTLNPHSPFRTTSLLEDIYGHQSVRGMVTTVTPSVTTPPGAGGLVDILAINTSTPREQNRPFSPVKDAYGGCVLTFISGPAKGLSARVLESWPPGTLPNVTDYKFRLFVLRNEHGYDQTIPPPPPPPDGWTFVINGRPFSGTGIGYNPDLTNGGGRVNARQIPADPTSPPLALLPNPAFFSATNPLYGNDPAGLGGVNEDYDAPDYQNPFLAFYANPNVDPTIPNSSRQIKPSFHDPALLTFWAQQSGGLGDPALVRQIFFRPNPVDHPVFHRTSNPALHGRLAAQTPNFALGPWDIDNDGDGVPDSVWVDPGYPAQVTKDGRLYKPLAAVLILDLDGRLNVNAHGSVAGDLLEELPYAQIPHQNTSSAPILAGGATLNNPPRGSGYGPAEIRLSAALSQNSVRALFSGVGNIPGRYGFATDGQAGEENVNDKWSALKLFTVPPAWPGLASDPGIVSAYGSPPDIKGMLAMALDPHGQPVWDKPSWTDEHSDDPYELDLSRDRSKALAPFGASLEPYDSPFSVTELERLLRPNDIDSRMLPDRLLQLLGDRPPLTTDSWDLPVPSMLAGSGMRVHLGNAPVPGRMTSLVDLVHARLSARSVNESDKARSIDALLAPDVRRGLRMNINRPFGDGLDNPTTPGNAGSKNGIVDDAAEINETLNYQTITGQNQSIPLDSSNGQDVNFDEQFGTATDRILSRQLLARHLYVLMMLCSNENFFFPLSVIPPTPTQTPDFAEPSLDANLAVERRRELKAKKLAQWAINVVDFRDADNIMTPFEFDTEPFDGWNVDGNPRTVEDRTDPRTGQPQRGLVFGCEMPVALITETLAFHDRRVKDTDHDDGPGTKRDSQNPDPTLDQPYIPRGSAFVEIMSIFDPNVRVQSMDLFVYQNNKWLLDLGKLAPDGNPVWRLAVTEFHTDDAADQGKEPVSDIISEHPDTVSLQPFVEGQTPVISPWNFSLLNQPADTHDLRIERIVSFANAPLPAGSPVDDMTYFATTSNARLEGFQYAIVGPGGTGAGARENNTVDIMVGWNEDDDRAQMQQIGLEPSVTFKNTASGSQANVKPAIGIPVASPATVKSSDPAVGAWGANDRVGFSISEPLFSDATRYYPKPDTVNTQTNLEEAYGQEEDDQQKFLDEPLDSKQGMPLRDRDMLKNGTHKNVRTVFLQRLADPTMPHHPQANPYITVDWMPFDLTVFNGEDRYPEGSMVPEDAWDPDDPSPDSDTNQEIAFSTRERGKVSTSGGLNTDYNIWTPVSEHPFKGQGQPNGPAQNYFRHRLVHTLGHLNSSFGPPAANAAVLYLGAPQKPFPWIRWANRPFTSALELMEVPACSPARLCLEFNYVVPGGATPTTSPYDTSPAENPYMRQFNHLLNFFRATNLTGNQPAGDFYRLFEFVQVPSPFVGTETMLDPNVFHTQANGNAAAGTESLRAPFNWVSNYRDPGKVNLNTINSPAVFDAVMGVRQGQRRIPFGEFWANRRGGPPPGVGTIATTPVQGLPTIMANVYRSGAGGDMVPDLPGSGAQRDALKTEAVHHTLLRRRLVSGARPLFADPSLDPNQSNPQLNVAIDANRNPAFRYRDLARLANLTTTRSNVYAIWITVGYFEVFPNPGGVDAGHPDGLQLGSELGSDTGEVRRHRGFYILDRTIPVGFERGFNHNVDRAIVLKRFIE